MHAANAKDHFASLEQADFYICGPGPFMDIVEGALEERKVGRGHIFIERFVSPADPDRMPAEEPPAAKPAGAAAASFICTLEKARHTVPVAPGETPLAAGN